MSKNIKTLVCCILSLVFVAGTVVAVFADSAAFDLAAELTTEDATAEDMSEVASEVESEVASEVESEVTTEAVEVESEEVSEEVSEEESSEATKTYLIGDVDFSGKVDAADARLTLRAAAQLEVFSDLQLILANVVVPDSRITAADARAILRVSADLDPAFGTIAL